MKLYLKQKTVLDEREMQEMYRIEHRGLWAMYTLLCAAVVVQLFFGAGVAQIAGEACVIALISVAMIIAYARRGIWDAHARPSARGNAAYAALCALGVTVVSLGMHRGDVYKRQVQLAPGKKSVAFSLTFRNAERTLSDEDVNPVMKKILSACEQNCGAALRL